MSRRMDAASHRDAASRRTGAAKRWPGWLILAVVAAVLLVVGASRGQGPSTPQDRVDDISRHLACPVCDGESVFESRNASSQNIRNVIEQQVATGTMSDDEIIAHVQRSQQADLLLVPRSSGFEALAWALPAMAVVIAAGALTVTFMRWRRETSDSPTEADRELVEAALREPDDTSTDGPR